VLTSTTSCSAACSPRPEASRSTARATPSSRLRQRRLGDLRAVAASAPRRHTWPEDGECASASACTPGRSAQRRRLRGLRGPPASRIGDLGHGARSCFSRTDRRSSSTSCVRHAVRELGEARLPGSTGRVIFQSPPRAHRPFPALGARRAAAPPQSSGRAPRARGRARAMRRTWIPAPARDELIVIEAPPAMGRRGSSPSTRNRRRSRRHLLTARGVGARAESRTRNSSQLFAPAARSRIGRGAFELLGGPPHSRPPLRGRAAHALGRGRDDVSFAMLHRLFWLARTSATRPFVIAIDDLHWPTVPRWPVTHLQRRLEGLPLLVSRHAPTRPEPGQWG